MRTNLSKFTVGFSDLAWESVCAVQNGEEMPMFPRARQVGMYLEQYAERFIPSEVVKLQAEVVRTVRKDDSRGWKVGWVDTRFVSFMTIWLTNVDEISGGGHGVGRRVVSHGFDYLVVASGYFSNPCIPAIPGLAGSRTKVIHSSAFDRPGRLQQIYQGLSSGTADNKLVVIGGSMSGVEAASALALHLSSLTSSSSSQRPKDSEVHHISSKPFWTLPTYLPQTSASTETVPFLPLDLVMYNLDRRSPGPVKYFFGPLPPEQIVRSNENFRALLGDDYAKCGHITTPDGEDNEGIQATWVAIGNDYSEFVRSGAIHPTIGRVSTIQKTTDSNASKIEITSPSGQTSTLDGVGLIVLATGYTPHASLSFLPSEALSKLEYSPTDAFMPLILDTKGSAHAEIPDLGFVGFYKGPYWGAMEMQARSLGRYWAGHVPIHFSEEEMQSREDERQTLRDSRTADPAIYRGQFPMGDYTGLMESFARDMSIDRAGLDELGLSGRSGPVIPSRYTFDESGLASDDEGRRGRENEVESTLRSLRDTLTTGRHVMKPGLAMALFRALHGTWRFFRAYQTGCQGDDERKTTGKASFLPRYPNDNKFEKEYLCEEIDEHRGVSRCLYSLLDSSARSGDADIQIGTLDEASQSQVKHSLTLSPAAKRMQSGEAVPGEYVVRARAIGDSVQVEYVFNLEGVAISSWECTRMCENSSGHGDEPLTTRTTYSR